MSKTLLQLTQNILSAMNSDEVNSIYDTVEALQVATVVVETLESEFNNLDLPSFNRILQLKSVSNTAIPNSLTFGEEVIEIDTLRYRNNKNSGKYQVVEWLRPDVFFTRQLMYGTGTGPSTRLITDPSGVTYYINTDRTPTFYTSVDNKTLIFDSYDSSFETTMEGINSFVIGSTLPGTAVLVDDYIPPIPNNLFPLLLAEAKAVCFLTFKQMPNPKSEQIARRQRSRMQHNLYESRKANEAYARSKFNFARNR